MHFDFIDHPMKLGAKKRVEQLRTELIMMKKRFTDILIDMNCIKIDTLLEKGIKCPVSGSYRVLRGQKTKPPAKTNEQKE